MIFDWSAQHSLYKKKISKKNINAIFCIIDCSLLLQIYYGNQYISLLKLIRNKFSQYEIRKKKKFRVSTMPDGKRVGTNMALYIT